MAARNIDMEELSGIAKVALSNRVCGDQKAVQELIEKGYALPRVGPDGAGGQIQFFALTEKGKAYHREHFTIKTKDETDGPGIEDSD